jgi:hypothetical protein
MAKRMNRAKHEWSEGRVRYFAGYMRWKGGSLAEDERKSEPSWWHWGVANPREAAEVREEVDDILARAKARGRWQILRHMHKQRRQRAKRRLHPALQANAARLKRGEPLYVNHRRKASSCHAADARHARWVKPAPDQGDGSQGGSRRALPALPASRSSPSLGRAIASASGALGPGFVHKVRMTTVIRQQTAAALHGVNPPRRKP